MTRLLAGFRISRVPPSAADFHSPLMNRLAAPISFLRLQIHSHAAWPADLASPYRQLSDPFHFAFLDENLQAFPAEILHERLRVQRLGHHDSTMFDLPCHEKLGRQGWWNSCLHLSERVPVLLVNFAMVVHCVNEVFHPFPILG